MYHNVFKKLFNQYISISDNTRRAMEAIGIPSSKIVVINNPVDSLYYMPELDRNAAKKELGIPENILVIGTACRFAPEKDLDLFIRTAKIVARMQENVIFVLVGGGKQKGQLIKLAELSGIGDRTIFIDFRLDMVNVWRAFDIFLFTSISESFGRTLLESLACEIPIVAALPRTGGAIDIIKRCPGIINTGGRNEVITGSDKLIAFKRHNGRSRA